MYTQLFFDDQRLFVREGLERDYGEPSPIEDAVYFDGTFSTDLRCPFVFRTEDGRYRMIYTGKCDADRREIPFIAVSDDGIHFVPENTVGEIDIPDRVADHQLMSPVIGGEIACIFRNDDAAPDERYVMLTVANGDHPLTVAGFTYVSPDLKHWRQLTDVEPWNGGTCEPIVGIFRNVDRGNYTVLRRPCWGDRRVGHIDTEDFRTYTPYEPCMQCDSLDAPLDEIYGISTVTDLGSVYVGTPLIYGNIPSAHNSKFRGGDIYAQLAYSFDGHHWQRSLRKPFLNHTGSDGYLCWLSSILKNDDGSFTIFASTSDYAHGTAFITPGSGRIRAYHLRKDGFIQLRTGKGADGTLATREIAWQGGDLVINLQAQKATVALYETPMHGDDVNIFAFGEPIPGFTHEDCVPFSGDSTEWVPQFRGGSMEPLKGKTLFVELKLTDGSIWSIGGDFVPLMNTEAARYRKLGVLPKGTNGGRF